MSRQVHLRLDHTTVKEPTAGVRPQIATDFVSYPNSTEDEQKARLQCAIHATDADECRTFLEMLALL